LQRLGEHHGIGTECVSEWWSVANADGNCNSYAERYCETQCDGEATPHTSASTIGRKKTKESTYEANIRIYIVCCTGNRCDDWVQSRPGLASAKLKCNYENKQQT